MAAVVLTLLATLSIIIIYIALCAWQIRTIVPSSATFTGNTSTTLYNTPYQICIGYTIKLYIAGRFWIPFLQTPSIIK